MQCIGEPDLGIHPPASSALLIPTVVRIKKVIMSSTVVEAIVPVIPLARIHRWTRTEGVRTLEGGVRKLQMPIIPGVNATAHHFGGFGFSPGLVFRIGSYWVQLVDSIMAVAGPCRGD